MTSDSPLKLAVTLGDPRGIGPEVAVAAASRIERSGIRLILVGPASDAVERAADEVVPVGAAAAADADPAEAGRTAGLAIERAVELVRDGRADAIVTGPIDKSALRAAGYPYPGHTEMLADLSGTDRVGMLMTAERTALGGPLRVLLATTHRPLATVPGALSITTVVEQARLANAGLREGWRISTPRLALCALNPHASDGGLFGDEEERILAPACARLRSEGIEVRGPIPADTVFVRAVRGEFDLVVAPYHDVGMAAFKTAAFGRGVNVTLGLPFVRTSPDHGTALDIAGTGRADPASMTEAMALAARLAAGRRARRAPATAVGHG